jgi:hypothetical protein
VVKQVPLVALLSGERIEQLSYPHSPTPYSHSHTSHTSHTGYGSKSQAMVGQGYKGYKGYKGHTGTGAVHSAGGVGGGWLAGVLVFGRALLLLLCHCLLALLLYSDDRGRCEGRSQGVCEGQVRTMGFNRFFLYIIWVLIVFYYMLYGF